MKGLFKSSKARSPAELVSHLRDLLIVTDQSATTPTRNTKKVNPIYFLHTHYKIVFDIRGHACLIVVFFLF